MSEKCYKVKWVVDVYARTAREAARKAQRMQRDPESTATIFQVEYHDVITSLSGKSKSSYVTEEIDLLS